MMKACLSFHIMEDPQLQSFFSLFYLFIYFYVGHLIIDGGYACMIETFEAVDVVALKNPCSHLNLCPLILSI